MRVLVAVVAMVMVVGTLWLPSSALAALPADRPVRIQPMGDSETRGMLGMIETGNPSGADTPYGGYRGPLQARLDAAGLSYELVGAFEDNVSRHSGANGWTTRQLREQAPDWLREHPTDILLLLAGTNDIARDQESQFGELLDTLVETAPEMIVLVAPIPPAIMPAAWPARVGPYNAAARAEVEWRQAAGQQVRWVPMTWRPSFVGDGVHPSEAGYRALADAWAEAILALR